MAVLTVQQAVLAGLNPSYGAAGAGGDSFSNDGHTVLHVKNGDSSAHAVTVASQAPARAGYSPANNVVSVPAGGERIIGPFPPEAFSDANGAAQVTYAAVTSMTVAAIRIG